MREILFRGKRTDTGKWVEGFYTLYANNRGVHPCILTGTAQGCVIPKFVNPETVGQYTGLTDKNGKKIFEGDIVQTEIYNGKRYEKIVGVITYIKENMAFAVYQIHERMCDIIDELHHKLEIIGNIHDNPELLKESEDTEEGK